MSIYPYVYRLDHPETGEFYIGYREANKTPAEQDLGIKYFTSSKTVKPRFHEFKITIIAECFDSDFAYELEQELIYENFDNNLCLNKHCSRGKNYFKLKNHTEESKLKMSNASKGKFKSKDHKKNISNGHKGKVSVIDSNGNCFLVLRNDPKYLSGELIFLHKGKSLSKEHKEKIGNSRAKTYEIISPIGEVIIITNLKKFCQENNLISSRMYSVAKGKLNNYKGWKVNSKET